MIVALFDIAIFFNRATANAETITIGQVFEGTNTVEFTFASTWPPGTSYQPQFLRQVGGTWTNLPDAHIEEVDGAVGLFRVSAPQFGGVSGFYRVLNAVSSPDDPAPNTIGEPDPDELFVIWSRTVPLPQTGSATQISGKTYYHLESPAGGPVTNSFETNATTRFALNGSLSVGTDLMMSDLDGDSRVDPLMVMLDLGNKMVISIAEVNATNFSITQRATLPVSNHVVRTDSVVPPLIRVLRANFDGAENPRVWLAWLNTVRNVQFELIEFRQNLSEYATLASFTVTPGVAFDSPGNLLDRSGWFDVASGDFDGDGDDELALLTTQNVSIPNGSGNWQLYVRFFKYLPATTPFLGADTIADQDRVLYLKGGTSSTFLSRLAGHADDFNGDGQDELAVVYETGNNSDASRWYLQFLKPGEAFDTLAKFPAAGEQIDQTAGSTGYPLDLRSGEFDGDPLPELTIGTRKLLLYDVRTNLTYSKLTEDGLSLDPGSPARRFMTLANLDSRDPNIGFRSEIVVAAIPPGGSGKLQVQSYKVNGDSNTFYRIDGDAVINDESFERSGGRGRSRLRPQRTQTRHTAALHPYRDGEACRDRECAAGPFRRHQRSSLRREQHVPYDRLHQLADALPVLLALHCVQHYEHRSANRLGARLERGRESEGRCGTAARYWPQGRGSNQVWWPLRQLCIFQRNDQSRGPGGRGG
jgi:hypothetical protein